MEPDAIQNQNEKLDKQQKKQVEWQTNKLHPTVRTVVHHSTNRIGSVNLPLRPARLTFSARARLLPKVISVHRCCRACDSAQGPVFVAIVFCEVLVEHF
jgi:hypothetical protein